MKATAIALAALLLFGPAASLIGVALVMSPAALATCTTGGPLQLGQVPGSLTATTAGGARVTLGKAQLENAATIVRVGGTIDGAGRPGILIALMAALTESGLRMLANPVYPSSLSDPNDGIGTDHDSLGMFQMRPASGWGTVTELMDPTYQVRAFFGGPQGPNYPSPRGLLDIPGWQLADPGVDAQSVEGSAHPDRYANYQPVAKAILSALTTSEATSASSTAPLSDIPEAARLVFPLPQGSWVRSSGFGPRVDPITRKPSFHPGLDLAAPGGTPIFAIADGVVTVAQFTDAAGGLIVIESTIDGRRVATAYRHMWQNGILVTPGEIVTAGQHIGDVGSSGHSTGDHLHVEIRPGGTNAAPVDPEPWFAAHHLDVLDALGVGDGPASRSQQCMTDQGARDR